MQYTAEAARVPIPAACGTAFDGTGGEPFVADLGVRDRAIVFIGDAESSGFTASETIEVSGLWVAPGFIDAHSHAALDEDYGKDCIPYVQRGSTLSTGTTAGLWGGSFLHIFSVMTTERAKPTNMMVPASVGGSIRLNEFMEFIDA